MHVICVGSPISFRNFDFGLTMGDPKRLNSVDCSLPASGVVSEHENTCNESTIASLDADILIADQIRGL